MTKKQPENKKPGQRVKRAAEYDENLPCQLTETELLEFGQRLAAMEDRIREFTEEAEAQKKALKAREAELEAERSRLAAIVRGKKEYRRVDVVELHDYETGQWRKVREDTGEVLEERPLQPGEREKLPMDVAPVVAPRLQPLLLKLVEEVETTGEGVLAKTLAKLGAWKAQEVTTDLEALREAGLVVLREGEGWLPTEAGRFAARKAAPDGQEGGRKDRGLSPRNRVLASELAAQQVDNAALGQDERDRRP